MFVYIFIAILIAIFSICQNEQNKKKLLLIGVGLLFVISGWRGYSVGIDTLNYKIWFDVAGDSIRTVFMRSNEWLFPILMYIINRFGYDYRIFLIVTAAIYSFLVWVVCKKSDRPLTALLFFWILGYYFQFYNISRQIIAALLTMCAFFFLQEDKKKIWFLLIIAAMFVHTSALVALLQYPISKWNISNKNIGIVVLLLLATFMMPFFFNTGQLLARFENFGDFGDLYLSYLDQSSANKEQFSFNRLFVNLYYVSLLFFDRAERKNTYASFVISYLLILNIFPFSGIVGRISIYFGCFQMLYLPIVGGQNTVNRIVSLVYPLAVFALFLITNNTGIIPYVFGGRLNYAVSL